MVGFDVGDNKIEIITRIIDETGKPIKEIVENIKDINDATKKHTKSIYKYAGGQRKLTGEITKTIKGQRQFKMHLLSTMFLGMQIRAGFMSLVAPAFEVAGIFDIISVILEDLFLPAAIWASEVLLKIMDVTTGLPEPIKALLSVIALLGIAFGTGLASFSSFSLGLQGLPATLANLGMAIKGTMASITGLAAPILIIIAVIAALWLAWKYNFGNIREHAAQIVDGIKAIFRGLGQFLSGDFIGGLKTIISGFKEIGKGIIGFIVDGIKEGAHLIADALYSIPVVGPVIKSAVGTVKSIGSGIVDWAKGLIGGKKQNDFVSRPGMPPISFSPNDTLIGVKNPGSLGGMGGGKVTVNSNVYLTASVSSGMDVRKIADDISKQIRQEVLKFGVAK